MMEYPGRVKRLRIRQGASYARGTTIDAYLTPEDCQALYELWNPAWPEPLAFPGNVKAITCEMVLDIPEQPFVDHFSAGYQSKSAGRSLGFRIREAASRNAGR